MHFHTLFHPRSIAIVGASTREGAVGNDIIRNLQKQGYRGHLYPVNPKGEPILGLTTYRSLLDIPRPVDLAVIVIPAAGVPAVMHDIGTIGTQTCVIISAGFKETGPEGALLEQEVVAAAKQYDITVIGPNCLGIMNPHHALNISFAKATGTIGNVAFISQSGALCSSVLDYAGEYGIGFSKFASVGNKACFDEGAFLEYLAHDDETAVILMYIESIANPQEFMTRAQTVVYEKRKPIVVLKSGRTAHGASASASHTGALAGNDTAYDALFKQAGIIRVYSVEELFVYAAAFAHNTLPDNNRVAIVTNAGGPGVLVTDQIAQRGLVLAQLSDSTQQQLQNVLPKAANTHNPIDVLGDAPAVRYNATLRAVVADTGVDAIIVILTPQSMTPVEEIAHTIATIKQDTKKPIITSFMGTSSTYEAERILCAHNVANILFPEAAADAMGALWRFASDNRGVSNVQSKVTAPQDAYAKSERIISAYRAQGKGYIPETEAQHILRAYGFPLLRSTVVTSDVEMRAAQQNIDYPVAMKIISSDIVHKSDVGGVKLHVQSGDFVETYMNMLKTVHTNVPQAHLDGVLLVEMAPQGGFECVLGVKKDPALGHMIMVGMGGVYIEIFKDVAFRLTPLTEKDADTMIEELHSKPFFDGVRGGPPLDRKSLVTCILQLAALVRDFPEIIELDMNPVLVLPRNQGVRILDSRIVIETHI